MGLHRKCKYRVSLRNPTTLHAKCTHCKAFLSYRLIQDGEDHVYLLKKFDHHHEHRDVRTTTKKEAVRAYFRSLPPEVNPAETKKFVLSELGVSAFTFYQGIKEFEGTNDGLPFKSILPIV